MFPLAVGVVMALFTGSTIHAAEQIERSYSIEQPEERESFTQLKKSELRRAAWKKYIKSSLHDRCDSVHYEFVLGEEGKLIEQSVRLAIAYKKDAGIESPKHANVLPREIVKGREEWHVYIERCKKSLDRLAEGVEGQVDKEIAKKLFEQIQAARMSLPAYWSCDFSGLREQDIGFYHPELFKYYMACESLLNEMQKKTLKYL